VQEPFLSAIQCSWD